MASMLNRIRVKAFLSSQKPVLDSIKVSASNLTFTLFLYLFYIIYLFIIYLIYIIYLFFPLFILWE